MFDKSPCVFLVLQPKLQNSYHPAMGRALQPHPCSLYHGIFKISVANLVVLPKILCNYLYLVCTTNFVLASAPVAQRPIHPHKADRPPMKNRIMEKIKKAFLRQRWWRKQNRQQKRREGVAQRQDICRRRFRPAQRHEDSGRKKRIGGGGNSKHKWEKRGLRASLSPPLSRCSAA